MIPRPPPPPPPFLEQSPFGCSWEGQILTAANWSVATSQAHRSYQHRVSRW